MTVVDLPEFAAAMTERAMFVFPVSGKVPMTDNGFDDAVGSPDAARALFAQHLRATGIGIDCGRSGLLVIDLDGAEAHNSWTRLLVEHGVVATLEVATGRVGGRHLWFSTADERSRSSVGKLAPKIDTRGRRGYVLCPPSLHASGARYCWLGRRPMADAPEWLLEKLAPPPPPLVGERRSLGVGVRLTAYGRAALDGLADRMLAASEGTRNETLLECSRRAGRLEAAGEIEASLAEEVIVLAAVAVGLPAVEADKTFRSGFEFGRQYPTARAAR